ncbi:MAG: toprim domain-containing protein [Nanoarchaeota archaeon]
MKENPSFIFLTFLPMGTINFKQNRLSTQNILKVISEYDIYEKYISNESKQRIRVGKSISSPLRKDKNPSFSLYISKKSGKLCFIDFGTGEYGDCFTFVSKLFNIGFYESLKVINDGFLLNLQNTVFVKDTVGRNKSKEYQTFINNTLNKETSFYTILQPFKSNDLNYWSKYNVNFDILSKFNVHSCKNVVLNNRKIIYTYNKHNPGFVYFLGKRFKVYIPFGKGIKWLSSKGGESIQGLKQLPDEGDLVIITKSMKDVMVLYSLGYHSIAPFSETQHLEEELISDLKKRFNKVVIFYDADKAGYSGSEKAVKRFKIKRMFIQDSYCILNAKTKSEPKDISDYIYKEGKEKSKELIEKMLETI